jgi:hypothetical protein
VHIFCGKNNKRAYRKLKNFAEWFWTPKIGLIGKSKNFARVLSPILAALPPCLFLPEKPESRAGEPARAPKQSSTRQTGRKTPAQLAIIDIMSTWEPESAWEPESGRNAPKTGFNARPGTYPVKGGNAFTGPYRGLTARAYRQGWRARLRTNRPL